MTQAKVCLLGAFAVGKTSLVTRFVTSIFDHRYHTTVGVRIEKKTVSLAGQPLDLVIWDIAGEDAFHQVRPSYLRGAAGYLLVVDGTRRRTLATAFELQGRAHAATSGAPFLFLLNKSDQAADWELDDVTLADLDNRRWPWLKTSALTGLGVGAAFDQLARQIVATTR